MSLLTLELSELEVEPIELQEVGSSLLQREQNKSLETLSTEGKNDVVSILTLTTFLPVNSCGGPFSCACSCTCLDLPLKCGCGCSCNGPNCQGSCSCSCNCTVR
jgi:hypothetical protein